MLIFMLQLEINKKQKSLYLLNCSQGGRNEKTKKVLYIFITYFGICNVYIYCRKIFA